MHSLQNEGRSVSCLSCRPICRPLLWWPQTHTSWVRSPISRPTLPRFPGLTGTFLDMDIPVYSATSLNLPPAPWPTWADQSMSFFFFFGHTPWHVGPQFPNQGWNACPGTGRWSVNQQTTGEVSQCPCVLKIGPLAGWF